MNNVMQIGAGLIYLLHLLKKVLKHHEEGRRFAGHIPVRSTLVLRSNQSNIAMERRSLYPSSGKTSGCCRKKSLCNSQPAFQKLLC